MAKGRRKQIIQSHDEYLSEEHIAQERHGQNTEASELHSSARGDQIDSDGEIEVNLHERWRQHKSNLKSRYFDEHKSTKANHSNVPNGIIADQWIALVDNWTTKKAQDISNKNRVNCTKKKSTHTAGTKSFARNREELREKDPEKKYPHRVVLDIHTHQTKSEKNTNAHVGDLKELIVQQPGLAETSQGKVAWKGDALSKILGEEKHGHVHGLGLVPNPNQVFDISTSKRLKNVNLTSLDETSSEDIVSLRLEMEKLEQCVRNQDATILQLQQNTRTLEQKHIQQGCLDDPVYAPKDGYCDDVPYTKRKRVYSDPQNQDSSMDGQRVYSDPQNQDSSLDGPLNDTMNGQADNVDDDDLQPHYKYLSPIEKRQRKIDVLSSNKQREQTTNVERPLYKYYSTKDKSKEDNAHHEKIVQANKVSAAKKVKSIQNDIRLGKNKDTTAKIVDHEISSNCLNHEASYFQNKTMSTGAGAAVLANKYQYGTKNSPAANSLKIGTKVFLKSMRNQNKDVAFGTVLSCDPTQKIGGVQLGKEFFMVYVSIALAQDEPLVRPYKNYKVIGDVAGASIAWPSTFVQC